MHEIRRPAQALIFVALAACATPPAKAKPMEPLVIPPIGSAGATQVAPPPPPPAPHPPSPTECDAILRRVVELTLDQAQMLDPAHRDEAAKAFMRNADTRSICGDMKVDDASMRCVADATQLEELYKCLQAAREP